MLLQKRFWSLVQIPKIWIHFFTYKPRGASPRRDYEDGISTNGIIEYVLLLYLGVGNDT